MSYFSNNLRELRESSGFKSARHFHIKVVEQGEKSFNYPYYVRLEKGSSSPSAKTLNSLLKHFDKAQQEQLIKSWCQDQFPNHKTLFKTKENPKASVYKKSLLNTTQANQLSNKEIYTLYKSKVHYLVFLLTTLSRSYIKITDLHKYFEQELLDLAITDLKKENLISVTNNEISIDIVDRVFPPPSHNDIRNIYNQFDEWDSEISSTFNFEVLVQRKFVRRVSYRYIKLMENHINLLLDFIKSSDEVNYEHNDYVVSFQVDFKSGQLPG